LKGLLVYLSFASIIINEKDTAQFAVNVFTMIKGRDQSW